MHRYYNNYDNKNDNKNASNTICFRHFIMHRCHTEQVSIISHLYISATTLPHLHTTANRATTYAFFLLSYLLASRITNKYAYPMYVC